MLRLYRQEIEMKLILNLLIVLYAFSADPLKSQSHPDDEPDKPITPGPGLPP